MTRSSPWTAAAAMSLFVALWGSAAIFTRWALDHGDVLPILVTRYTVALLAVLALARTQGPVWPEPGTRGKVAAVGLLMIGGYSVCYFQAMAHGLTPGLLATMLGIQPILTLLATERRFPPARLAGLVLALGGLVLVVYQSLVHARLSWPGIVFALLALACMTGGAMAQKAIAQPPLRVLPLQYVATLALYALLWPFQSTHAQAVPGFWIPVLWLALVVSVAAQLLLYRMIARGNLVDVTSLFYLVPGVTAGLDYLLLGNAMPALAVAGMLAILAGLALVFRKAAPLSAAKRASR